MSWTDQPEWVHERWVCSECGTHNDVLILCDSCGHTPDRLYEKVKENTDQEAWDERVERGREIMKVIAGTFILLLVVSNVFYLLHP